IPPTDLPKGRGALSSGSLLRARVALVDRQERRLVLTCRDVTGDVANGSEETSSDDDPPKGPGDELSRGKEAAERKAGPSTGRAGATLGDVLRDRLGDFSTEVSVDKK